MKILLVEDEKEILRDLDEYLGNEGYLIEKAATMSEAKSKIFVYDYDVLVLDIGLPDGNGLEVLEYLKKYKKETGVLILSARDALDDKLTGLDLGADDYMTKPYHLSELNARIKSILRRRKYGGSDSVDFKEINIDTAKMEVKVHETPLVLTRKEYELILYMVSNSGKVLTKESIVEHLWGDDSDTFDSFDFIYTHIKNVRRKIMQVGGNDYLKSVYGLGYKFESD